MNSKRQLLAYLVLLSLIISGLGCLGAEEDPELLAGDADTDTDVDTDVATDTTTGPPLDSDLGEPCAVGTDCNELLCTKRDGGVVTSMFCTLFCTDDTDCEHKEGWICHGFSWSGGEPAFMCSPPAILGRNCTHHTDCETGACLLLDNRGGGFCTQQCGDDSECDGRTCEEGWCQP